MAIALRSRVGTADNEAIKRVMVAAPEAHREHAARVVVVRVLPRPEQVDPEAMPQDVKALRVAKVIAVAAAVTAASPEVVRAVKAVAQAATEADVAATAVAVRRSRREV